MTLLEIRRRSAARYLTGAGLAVLIGLTMPAQNAGAASPAAPSNEQSCTLAPAAKQSHNPASCIKATVSLDRIPSVGESAKVTVALASEVEIAKAKLSVTVPKGLRITSSGFSTPKSQGLVSISSKTLALGQAGRSVSFTVTADEAGPAQIQADVVDVQKPEVDRTAHASTELTVGATAAGSTKGVKGTRSDARLKDGTIVKDAPAAAPKSASSAAKGAAAAGASDVCATGTLQYSDYYGTWKPGQRVGVKVMSKATATSAPAVAASGVTTATGGYNFCFRPATLNTVAMWVEFSTSNDWWQVTEMTGATPYALLSAEKANVRRGSVQDFGISVPSALHMRAFHAFDVINKVYDVRASGTSCWTYEETANCGKLKARWAPGNTDGGYYSTAAAVRSVFLTDEMPDASTTVVHEAGHNLQHLLYNWNFTTSNCPSPHYLDRSSAPGCGWTEGFPNGLVAYLFPDGRYYYNVNTWMNLRQTGFSDPSLPTSRTNPDNGDNCECRIAGALYGLWTTIDNGPQKTLDNMDRNSSEDFEEWFNVDRPKTGLDVSAKARNQLFKYTIDYRKGKRTENITNPGLEDQGQGWAWTNGVVGAYSGYQPFAGRFYSWMGGNGVESEDEMSQSDIAIPATGTSLLDFQLRVTSSEPTTVAADSFEVQVIDESGEASTVFFRTNIDKATVYTHRVVDLSAWAGQNVTLRFVSNEDAGQSSDFVLDNISVYTR